jgi:hypothetical protein
LAQRGRIFTLEPKRASAILPRSDWGRPHHGTEGDAGDAHRTGFTTRFRQPDDYRPRKRYVWGTRQSRWLRTADGFAVFARAVRSIQDQQNQTLNQHDCSHPRNGEH